MQTARTTVTTAIDTAVMPKVHGVLDDAVADPRVAEGLHRSQAALAALKGELSLPTVMETTMETTSSTKRHPIFKGLVIAALLAAIGIALKQFLMPKDDGWTPQQPSPVYQPRPDSFPPRTTPAESEPATDTAEATESATAE